MTTHSIVESGEGATLYFQTKLQRDLSDYLKFSNSGHFSATQSLKFNRSQFIDLSEPCSRTGVYHTTLNREDHCRDRGIDRERERISATKTFPSGETRDRYCIYRNIISGAGKQVDLALTLKVLSTEN
jgi:hypothetical protein